MLSPTAGGLSVGGGGALVRSLTLEGQDQAWGAAAAVSDSLHPSVPSVKPFVQQAYPIQPAVTAPIPGESPGGSRMGEGLHSWQPGSHIVTQPHIPLPAEPWTPLLRPTLLKQG